VAEEERMKENSAGRREGPSGIEGASGDQPSSSAATGEIPVHVVVLKCIDYGVIFVLGLSLAQLLRRYLNATI